MAGGGQRSTVGATLKDSSRQRLLSAAKELFAEHGFDATTTAVIARMAHTSQSQLLKYFKDKNGLLTEVLNEGWHELNSAIRLATARIPIPGDQLRLILDMLLNYLEINQAFSRVFLREGDRFHESDAGTREFAEILDGVFEWMMAIGELPSEISPHALRVGLMGALKSMLRERVFNRHDIPRFSENDLRKVFSKFLSSCTSPGERSQIPAIVSEQKEEQPWLNHYLELADMVLRPPSKPGQA